MKMISLRAAFFGSSKKKSRSVSRSEASSFGSNAASSSSEDSQCTPKTVLPRLPGCHLAAPAAKSASSSSTDYPSAEREGEKRITRRELEVVLRRLGPDPPTEEEVVAMLAEADRAGDGSIRLEEIVELGSVVGPPVVPELRETFAVFDADGDGKISAEELLAMFVTLGDEQCTLEDCRRMIGVVDSDGDGFVCFQDFVRMMDGQR
ncbi:probable calcium-binding protein CML36 [Phoenix dactylifera]|uniref:Probable calcium-binding protein CML36 n=1 Tax=Phoenix dactylifera TaxID=42345 RepID=A0A8B7BWP4_PHODC|nr:probable calcium-binding protein CML36 [Phoenix dactylifera]